MKTVYFEEQRMDQKWVTIILFSLLAILFVCSMVAIFIERVNLFLGLTPFLSILIFILLFRTIKLQTQITEEYISYRFLPLQVAFRKIRKQDIKQLQIRTYSAIREYGGWGMRFGRYGKAYTIKGNQGISITLHSNKNILIGTSRPQDAAQALKEYNYL